MSQIQAMNFSSFTSRGHSPITWTFTPHSQSQITQGLHFPSSTALTQLSALITHTPETNLTITITQSHTHTHTHTHYINSGLSHTHCWVLFSLATVNAFPSLPSLNSCVLIPARVLGLFSLSSPLDIVCRSPTHACPWIILVSCPCHTCLLLSDPACIDHVL